MSKLDKIKSLIPIHEIEYEAQSQIFDNANIPFVHAIAIMPDVHAGYDLPIGAVALVSGHISPSYVGYDIGCGMCCYEIPDSTSEKLTLKDKVEIYNEILEAIPVGFTENKETSQTKTFNSYDNRLNQIVNAKMPLQLGTLGGGNHFIEIGHNSKKSIFITIHSGSRRPGWEVGSWYMKVAKDEDKNHRKFFDIDSELGKNYLDDMNFMLEFALENRLQMLKKVLKVITGSSDLLTQKVINENHNHAEDLNSGFILHRKGATPAMLDQKGVIPGSMKTGVYITEGLGNVEYLMSASHGAGRKMSRGKAKKTIDLNYFKTQMNDIVANVSSSTLDEAPDAYKDLNKVIAAQEGIVIKTIDFIEPLINVKG